MRVTSGSGKEKEVAPPSSPRLRSSALFLYQTPLVARRAFDRGPTDWELEQAILVLHLDTQKSEDQKLLLSGLRRERQDFFTP